MQHATRTADIGLLVSGGLDSAILLAHLIDAGRRVQPFYVRSHLTWEQTERAWLQKYLRALNRPSLSPLVTLDLPLDDVYGVHWSTTGKAVPGADTPDEAVYLPGRNALLLIKAVIWCQLRGIGELALAPLGSNPFPDATDQFFAEFESALNRATDSQLRIVRPFATFSKRQVMELGRGYPLELTFSCIAPVDGIHCGECNKCEERRQAFLNSGLPDPTQYARGRVLK
ncbi:MAG TPA: 7-cyano-7-deazaguanine synthase [Pirellulales bacterium]|jgi:7-cyano-7-deazaguanine synthase